MGDACGLITADLSVCLLLANAIASPVALWQAAFLTYACGIKAPQLPCLGAGPLGSVTLVSHYPYGLSPGLNLINLDIILVGRKSLE